MVNDLTAVEMYTCRFWRNKTGNKKKSRRNWERKKNVCADADGADNPALPAVLHRRYPALEFVLEQMRPGLAVKNDFLFFIFLHFYRLFFFVGLLWLLVR